MRLVRVEGNSSWPVSSLFKNHTLYLIKSPERRKLGHTVVVPSDITHFPLGEGKLNFNYDFLEWVPR